MSRKLKADRYWPLQVYLDSDTMDELKVVTQRVGARLERKVSMSALAFNILAETLPEVYARCDSGAAPFSVFRKSPGSAYQPPCRPAKKSRKPLARRPTQVSFGADASA
jgi:hypothetical protein